MDSGVFNESWVYLLQLEQILLYCFDKYDCKLGLKLHFTKNVMPTCREDGGMSGSKRRQSIGPWLVGTFWDSLRLSPLEPLRAWMAAGSQSWVHTDMGHHQFVRLMGARLMISTCSGQVSRCNGFLPPSSDTMWTGREERNHWIGIHCNLFAHNSLIFIMWGKS